MPDHSGGRTVLGHAQNPSSSSIASSSSVASSGLKPRPPATGPGSIGMSASSYMNPDDKHISGDDREKHRPTTLILDPQDATPVYRSTLDRAEDTDKGQSRVDTLIRPFRSDSLIVSASSTSSSLPQDPGNSGVPAAHSPLTEQLFLANETVEHLARCLTGLKRRKAARERRMEASTSSDCGAGGPRAAEGSVTSLRELEMEVEARAQGSNIGLGFEEASADDYREDGGGDAEVAWMCCCESVKGVTGASDRKCLSREWRTQLEDELRLSGEIGQALLVRYSALLAKHTSTTTRTEEQSTLLARAYKKEAQLERGAEMHLRRWREMVGKNEGLERQLTAAQHSMTLSSATLLALRQEISALKSSRVHAKTESASLETTLMDARRLEVGLREDLEVERRGRSEEERKRRVAEKRADAMERRVDALIGEVEAGQVARERDGRELLANANETMGKLLHNAPSEEDPDVQRALGDLVAANALLRHDVTELRLQLTDSRNTSRALEREVDDLRINMGVAPRTPLEGETHAGPESSGSENGSGSVAKPSPAEAKRRKRHSIAVMAPPVKPGFVPRQLSLSIQSNASSSGHGRHQSLTPSLAASVASSSGRYGYAHGRNESLTPSMASNALSPRSSMAVAALGPAYQGESSQSPMLEGSDANQSPRLMAPPSHFVRLRMPGAQRPQSVSYPYRSVSMDRPPGPARGLSGVDSIGEHSDEATGPIPSSPSAAESMLAGTSRRKRTSFLGSSSGRRMVSSPSGGISPLMNGPPPSAAMSDGQFVATASDGQPMHGRRPLLLSSAYTSSKAVQTDDIEEMPLPTLQRLRTLSEKPSQSSIHSVGSHERAGVRGLGYENETMLSNDGRPQLREDFERHSEASSQYDARAAGLALLIDQMAKLLTKVRQSDVSTLSKRLRKQRLAGDVGYLSQSTIKGLSAEVTSIKLHFKSFHDEEKRMHGHPAVPESALTRKDMASLLKLFRELFSELVDLRSTVNEITLDPVKAQDLKAVVDAQEDEDKARQAGPKTSVPSGALGWMAPISKLLFTTAPLDTPKVANVSSVPTISSHASSANRPAPKLMASTSATTTHVNVEFAGGAGVVRRSGAGSGIQHVDVSSELPNSPSDSLSRGIPAASQGRAGPAITLGGGSTRGPPSSYKPALMGIFAGASGRAPHPADTHLTVGDYGTTRRLRLKTSQTLGPEKDPAGFVSGRTHKRQMSVAVDAVIDTALPEHMVGLAGRSDEEPGMQRTLRGRPRGLSDSSIRSTFVSHAAPSSVPMDRTVASPSALGAVPAMSRTTTTQTEAASSISGSSGATAAAYWPRNNSVMRKLGRGLGVIPPKDRSVSAPTAKSAAAGDSGISDRSTQAEVYIDGGAPPGSAQLQVNVEEATSRSPSVARGRTHGTPPKAIQAKRSISDARATSASGEGSSYFGSSVAGRSLGSDHLDHAMRQSSGGSVGGGNRLLGLFVPSESVFDEHGNMTRRLI